MKQFLFIIAVILPLQVVAQEHTLRIHGSSTVGSHLMPTMVYSWLQNEGYSIGEDKAFEGNHRVISAKKGIDTLNVEIQTRGSSTGFASLIDNKADIAIASRPIKPSEKDKLAHFGDIASSRNEIVVGVDGVAVIVHPNNPLSAMNVKDLRRIVSGKVNNWSDLGGTAHPIKLFSRDSHSGTYDTFKSLVLGRGTTMSATQRVLASHDAMIEAVMSDEGAIGFVSLVATGGAKVLAISDGTKAAFMPNDLTIATEDYPLSRRLYMYSPNQNSDPMIQGFNQFIKSKKGQSIVEKTGFVSQNITVYNKSLGDHYPAEYRALLDGALRLSMNFRFKQGEYELDNKAMQDIERLAAYTKKYKIGQVILAGFSDFTEGSSWRKYTLSTERGDFVAEALIKQGVIPSVVRGFGSSIQVANNETHRGRSKNRRVEIWIKEESVRASAEKRRRLSQQEATPNKG